jgi:integrase
VADISDPVLLKLKRLLAEYNLTGSQHDRFLRLYNSPAHSTPAFAQLLADIDVKKCRKAIALFEMRPARKPSQTDLVPDTPGVVFSGEMAKKKHRKKGPSPEWRSGPEGACEVRIYQPVNKKGVEMMDNVRYNLGVCTREEGVKKAAEKYAEVCQRTKPLTRIIVKEMIEEFYLTGYVATLAPSTQEQYSSVLRNYVIPIYGEKQLSDFTGQDIQRLVDRHPDLPGQMHALRSCLSGMFREAILQGFIERNPVQQVRLPRRHKEKEPPILTEEEFAKLLAVLEDPAFELRASECYQERNAPLAIMFHVASKTGMGYAELAGLWWRRLNLTDSAAKDDGKLLPRYSVAIRQDYVRGHLGPTKNRGRERIEALTADLVEMLLAHRAGSKYTGPDDYVFCRSDGKPLNEDAARRKLNKALVEAEVSHVGFHSFRHYYATESERDQRQTLEDRMRQLGHKSKLMTLQYSAGDIERRRVGSEKIAASLAETRRKLAEKQAENTPDDQTMTKKASS